MTRWLFICGLSFDLSGAVLIAWTIYSRTAAETREEALTRFNANFWVVLFREREQAHVRAGVALLAFGFVLQLAGYVLRFDFPTVMAAVFVAGAIFVVALLVSKRPAEQAVPIRYAEDHELPPGIEDERHIHRVASVSDVQTWRKLYADRILGKKLKPRSNHAPARINHGRWVFDCPVCGNSELATPDLDTVVCTACPAEYPADFPEDRTEIERLLLRRPEIQNRNWAGESIDQLRRENAEHGLLA